MSDEYNDSRGGAKYAFAMAFLFLIPGSLLAILRHFKPAFLSHYIVEFLFSFAILPIEKQAIAAFYDQSAPVDPIDSLGIYEQQILWLRFYVLF